MDGSVIPPTKDPRAVTPPWVITPYYYGDVVRVAFAIVIMASAAVLPILGVVFPFGGRAESVFLALLALLVVLTTPRHPRMLWIGVLAALAGIGLLEYAAYKSGLNPVSLLLLRQALCAVFLAALFFSYKTLRAVVGGHYGREQDRADLLRRSTLHHF